LRSPIFASPTAPNLEDALGSTRPLLTDLAGTITDEYTYDAYGTLTASQGTTDNRYLYTGQQFDATTGHYHLRARQYDPSLGRFMGMDTWPLDYSNPVELNRYVYAAGNPVMFSDPSGYNAYGLVTGRSSRNTSYVGLAVGAGAKRLIARATAWFLVGSLMGLWADIPANWNPTNDPVLSEEIRDAIEQLSDQADDASDADNTDDDSHYFYFTSTGGYPRPGRPTQEIIEDLRTIVHIPGISGTIGALKAQQDLADSVADSFALDGLMGRKFESERILWYAAQGNLARTNASARIWDLQPIFLGTITHIEIKWTGTSYGNVPSSTRREVLVESREHSTGTYLVEFNRLSAEDVQFFTENGGRYLFSYQYLRQNSRWSKNGDFSENLTLYDLL
jgi:RHS repeat-associated protein